MKKAVDVSVDSSQEQICAVVLFGNLSSATAFLSEMMQKGTGDVLFSGFDLADKTDLKPVAVNTLLSAPIFPSAVSKDGCRIDFIHDSLGSTVLSFSKKKDKVVKTRIYFGLDVGEVAIEDLLRILIRANCRQVCVSYDFDMWSQNCKDPDLFSAVGAEIPATAKIIELKFGNRVIKRLNIDENPGLEIYDSSLRMLKVAGWKNLFRLDIFAALLGCREDEALESVMAFFGEASVGVVDRYLALCAPVSVTAVSTNKGRDFQRRLMCFLDRRSG